MTRDRASIYLRFLVVFTCLGLLSLGSIVYVLVHERFTLPFQNVYDIHAEFSAADGVLAGTGQPVLVAGVNVGQITALDLKNGVAVATLQLDRGKVPHVYANATATLVPITPLDDMSIELSPGSRPAKALPRNGTLNISDTVSPVQFSELLDHLDADTRDYLTSLLTSLGQGVGDRGPGLRSALLDLGPTVTQLGQIGAALASRRTELAHFVNNLGLVSRAAARSGDIPAAIQAGDRTLDAITSQDTALRQTLADLPTTLKLANSTVGALKPLAAQLGPTLESVTPAIKRLPVTLAATQRFSADALPVISRTLSPLITKATPYSATLSRGIENLDTAAPNIFGTSQSLNYALNELAYDPGHGDGGFLFWIPWALHNINSVGSIADANGTIARAMLLVSCTGLEDSKALQTELSLLQLCPK